MIELLIVAPLERYKHQVPRGFSFTDEMFSEAKLDDPISKAQNLTMELQRAVSYLAHRYPQRVRARWVELWSPGGLWCAIRYKLRSFPVIILNQTEILTGDDLKFKALIDHISETLAKPQS
ncbi:MAG: hypothetical protein P8Y68_01665 [Anaerolineales bacterium]|jgi:hypothetical protein